MTSAADRREQAQAGVLQTFRELPMAARFVLLGVFINQFGAFLQAFMVLYLVDERGFTGSQAGIALGAYSAGAILGVLFGGGMSDRLGPRWTIVLSVGSAALLTLSVTMLDVFGAIVVAVTLAGAMTQAARPAVTALLMGLVPASRQVMTMAMYRTALHTGIVIGPLVAAWLSQINWDLVFYFDAISALTYAGIAAFLLSPDKVRESEQAVREPEGKPAAAGTKIDLRSKAKKGTYLLILRDTRYLAYLALMFVNGLVHIQFMAVLPLMLLAADYPVWAYSSAATLSALLIITCELPVVRVTQRWVPWVAVIVGWLMLVVGRSGYGLPGGLMVIYFFTGLAALGQSVGGAQAFAYPMKVAPPHAAGRYLGSAHATFQLGYALGPIIGILLWHSIGNAFWAVLFVVGVAMVVPGIWGMRPTSAPPSPAGVPTVSPGPAGLTADAA
ncbi:MAG TPA: MFS transporter, partial [Pseudonocardiaceae bacterium]|nr:MFS transporter [Pseudonocardiaceae bacterium]